MEKGLKRLFVKELHGLYNYDYIIPDTSDVSIITGPNGYGKTTLLNIISNIYQGSFWYFYYLVFREVVVEFVDNHSITLRKEIITDSDSLLDEGATEASSVKVLFSEGQVLIESFSITRDYISDILNSVRSQIMWPIQRANDIDELQNRYNLENDVYLQNAAKNTLLFLVDHPFRFVKARRLESSSEDLLRNTREQTMTVELISEEISNDFKKEQQAFAETSQKIDASFYKRLLHLQTNGHNEKDNQNRINNLRKRIDEYRYFHLVPNIEIEDTVDGEANNEVLALYLSDMETKMNSFSYYYNHLLAFDSFVSKCALSDKRMTISEKGLEIINDNNIKVPLGKLSDGEQDLLILGYYLYYATSANSLLLIDEPENSLHMAWLENMLESFVKSAKMLHIQIIVATHSPAFINDRWDLTYDLFENRL